jgi:hypothetical protein
MKIKKLLIMSFTITCLLILSIFTLPLYADSSQDQSFDFRQSNWGMTKQEITNVEKSQLLDSLNNGIYYSTTIANKDCILFYSFLNSGKLESGGYMFDIEHMNQNDYIDDYTMLKNLLTSKYGKPIEDKTNWKNDLYKNYPQYYGMAIGMGYLTYKSIWVTENQTTKVKTKIILFLYGDNLEVHITLGYHDKDYVENYVENNKYLPSSEGL